VQLDYMFADDSNALLRGSGWPFPHLVVGLPTRPNCCALSRTYKPLKAPKWGLEARIVQPQPVGLDGQHLADMVPTKETSDLISLARS
jgi:hypothetical protein